MIWMMRQEAWDIPQQQALKGSPPGGHRELTGRGHPNPIANSEFIALPSPPPAEGEAQREAATREPPVEATVHHMRLAQGDTHTRWESAGMAKDPIPASIEDRMKPERINIQQGATRQSNGPPGETGSRGCPNALGAGRHNQRSKLRASLGGRAEQYITNTQYLQFSPYESSNSYL